jgi:hypothetical protein
MEKTTCHMTGGKDFFYLGEVLHVEGGAVTEPAVVLRPSALGRRLVIHTLLLLLLLQEGRQQNKTNHGYYIHSCNSKI